MNLDCHYGFYLCSVFVLPSFLCPIAFILPVQVLCFPAGKIITYLTKEEIIAYETYADIQILHGYEFYPSEIQYPFRDYIDALHAQKQLLEKNDYQYDLVKKMMNSLYGCFYEKNVQDDKINTGKLFNPIYAAIITADTRIKLFETAVTREKNVIAMATDSLLFDRKIPLKTSTKLGGWQKESTGDAVVLQSGVYQIAGKLRTRGMQRTSKIIVSGKEFESIFDVIRADPKPTSYTIVQERPFHLRECLKRLNITTQECVNVWHESPKTFSVNRDIKRRWAQKFKHGGDIFETSHRSETWKFYSEK